MSVSLLPHRFASVVARVRGGSLLACLMVTTAGGCTAITTPIEGVPAKRVPPQLFAQPKNNLVPIDISLLSLEEPRAYQLAGGDVLGIYIEGVLPFNPPNQPPEPPPVNFPDAESTLPPSIGYPATIQADGTLDLPLLEPLYVEGLTVEQVREKIRQAYIDGQILQPEKARPIVTMIRERTYNIIVVREDGGNLNVQNLGAGFIRGGSDRSATGAVVKLPAYKNDVLNALVETGGLPGLNAKNEVKVLRASRAKKSGREEFLREFRLQQELAAKDPCICAPELPDDPSILRIPLRLPPGVTPAITEDDIRLEEGDIVYIESRETEVFYTGGLLPGGEFPLPRDYDLDVLGAMALAGTGVAGQQQGRGGGGGMGGLGGSLTPVPPGKLYILRKTPCDGQIAIEVDLAKAINDPRQRPLVAPGDILILQFKCEEELINFGIGTFFTFGIRELLSGR
ncbi:polysaccharide biosynthesis/export family protein [Planctomycetaceae bacterium SH139]